MANIFDELFERAMLDKKYIIDILNKITFSSPPKILDVGCGSGGTIKILREVFKNSIIVGVDNSKDALEYAKEKCEGLAEFINADACCMPFYNETFQCCIARMLFDISNECEKILDEMVRVLSCGGYMVIYGNVCTTALENELPYANKQIEAYKRYLRLTKRRGFDVSFIVEILKQKYGMDVWVVNIVKDVNDPGREHLLKYYAIPSTDLEQKAKNNILVKLNLIGYKEIISYEKALRDALVDFSKFVSFSQAAIVSRKREY